MDKGLVIRAAGLLMVVQVLSRLLGYVRDVVLLNIFSMGYATDAWKMAFRIPDFLYSIIAGGSVTAAFMPVFCAYLAKKEYDNAWRLSNIFLTWAVLLLGVGALLAAVFTTQLLGVLTEYSGEQLALTTALTRIHLIQSIFISIAAIFTGILQSHNKFTWPAISQLLYNVCIIVFGAGLAALIETRWPGYGVASFSVGVVLGSLAMLLVQMPSLRQVGFRYRPMLNVHDPGLHQLVRLLIPALIGLSVSQINLFVTNYLATGLAQGTLTGINIANQFQQMPLGVFAASLCIALFPTMTAQAANNDLTELKNSLSMGMRTILFVILPSATGLAVLGKPIVRMMYEFSGRVTASDTQLISQALAFYCIGMAGWAMAQILLRTFYARQDAKTPLIMSAAAIVINIVLSFLLVGGFAHRGLALAYSISGLSQALLLYVALYRRIGHIDTRHVARSFVKMAVACGVMALTVWGTAAGVEAWIGVASKFNQMLQVLAAIGVGVVTYFVATALMKMEELQTVINVFKSRLNRKKASSTEK